MNRKSSQGLWDRRSDYYCSNSLKMEHCVELCSNRFYKKFLLTSYIRAPFSEISLDYEALLGDGMGIITWISKVYGQIWGTQFYYCCTLSRKTPKLHCEAPSEAWSLIGDRLFLFVCFVFVLFCFCFLFVCFLFVFVCLFVFCRCFCCCWFCFCFVF